MERQCWSVGTSKFNDNDYRHIHAASFENSLRTDIEQRACVIDLSRERITNAKKGGAGTVFVFRNAIQQGGSRSQRRIHIPYLVNSAKEPGSGIEAHQRAPETDVTTCEYRGGGVASV